MQEKEGCVQEEAVMGQMLFASLFETGCARECHSNCNMTFAKAGCPAFLFVVEAVACAAGLLFWPFEVIMVRFFTVREFHKLLLKWFLPNRMATFPEFHNLKGIPQEKSDLFVCQWLNLEPLYLLIKMSLPSYCPLPLSAVFPCCCPCGPMGIQLQYVLSCSITS